MCNISIRAHLKIHTGPPCVGHVGRAAEDSLPVQQLCSVVGKYEHTIAARGVTETKRT